MSESFKIKVLEARINVMRKALEFYAEEKNWQSPSHGFQLQYDPERSPVNKAGGNKVAQDALRDAGVK